MLFLQQLQQHRRIRPRHPAIISDTRIVSYEALADLVEKGSSYLEEAGVRAQQVVGISIADEVDHFIASLSLLAAGAHQFTLATHETLAVRSNLAERAGATVLVADDPSLHFTPLQFVRWPGVDDLAAAAPASAAANDGRAMLYLNTSGTTGGSNLIPFFDAQIALQAQCHLDYAEERLLRLVPIEYNNSKRHRLYCLWNGGTNVFRPKGSLVDVIDFAKRHNVTSLDLSKMHLSELIALDSPGLLPGIKVRPGGSEVPAHVRQRIEEKVTPLLYVRYATTETGGISMALPFEHDAEATCGAPLTGVELQIVGASGEILGSGQVGEIRIKTPGMATCYLDNPEQTRMRFREGWFYPGDIGYLREDGHVVVKGRKDDMINLNGINIFPADIEHVLERHPDVQAAAALPLKSVVHGQIPVAAVEIKAGAHITALELQKYAHEHLALRAPRRIMLMDELPRNEQGKILRRKILEMFEHLKA